VPFILIDLVVATVLMSMGMMMMPPMTISLPLKILLFVLVDGWHLVVSFHRAELRNLILMNTEFAARIAKSDDVEAVTLAAPILLAALIIGWPSASSNPSRPFRSRR